MTNPHKHGISWRGGANGDVAPPLGGVSSGFGLCFSGFGFGVRGFEEEYTFFGFGIYSSYLHPFTHCAKMH